MVIWVIQLLYRYWREKNLFKNFGHWPASSNTTHIDLIQRLKIRSRDHKMILKAWELGNISILKLRRGTTVDICKNFSCRYFRCQLGKWQRPYWKCNKVRNLIKIWEASYGKIPGEDGTFLCKNIEIFPSCQSHYNRNHGGYQRYWSLLLEETRLCDLWWT